MGIVTLMTRWLSSTSTGKSADITVTAIDWLDWIGEHFASFDTLQFLVGLVASLVMAWAGWRVYQEAGRPGPATPPTSTVG